jgi:hypothetical protein
MKCQDQWTQTQRRVYKRYQHTLEMYAYVSSLFLTLWFTGTLLRPQSCFR